MKISIPAIFLLLFLSSCIQKGDTAPGKTRVSVSILPQKYFIDQLAGENVIVNVMVPPGASPATYEPSVSQLRQLDQSAIYIKLGSLAFELSWMDKIRSANPNMEVIDLSKGVALISGHEEDEKDAQDEHEGHKHSHGGIDPHIWMSARNAKVMVDNMADALKKLLPEDSVQIARRHLVLLNSIDALDKEIGDLLLDAEGRSFMIYHPSLSYYARDYKLKQLALEWEGKTPSPAHMRKLTDLGREHQIKSILIQSEFDSNNARILASEIGAKIVTINPLDENWPDQMLQIALKLREQW